MRERDSNSVSWIQANELVTPEFKASHKKMIEEALKEYPEYGLGFDPILNAQDAPDAFIVKSCDAVNKEVILQGAYWKIFSPSVYFKKIDGKWLIDRMGVVNSGKNRP